MLKARPTVEMRLARIAAGSKVSWPPSHVKPNLMRGDQRPPGVSGGGEGGGGEGGGGDGGGDGGGGDGGGGEGGVNGGGGDGGGGDGGVTRRWPQSVQS